MITDFTLKEAFLFGAIVSSTDAAAVISMLGGSNLKKRIRTVIEIESGSNDPMAYALILFVLSMFQAGDSNIFMSILFLIQQIIVGALMGVIIWENNSSIRKNSSDRERRVSYYHMIAVLFICFSATNLIWRKWFSCNISYGNNSRK